MGPNRLQQEKDLNLPIAVVSNPRKGQGTRRSALVQGLSDETR